MYLLDTMVISATASGREDLSALNAWIRASGPRLFLSTITAAEVVHGIEKARRQEARRRADALREWWNRVEHEFADRILTFDLAAARIAGKILDHSRAHQPGFEDIAIAATAEVHGLTVLTFNERHFAPLGVPYLNPLKELPASSP
ncbi:MAG: PIN domain-containing protein [Parvibaculaceae bacterium]